MGEYGKGSHWQRKDRPGTWRAQYVRDGVRTVKDHRSEPAAVAWLAGMDRAADQAPALPVITLSEWLRVWLDEVAARTARAYPPGRPPNTSMDAVSPTTLEHYQMCAKRWQRDPIGAMPLASVTPGDVWNALDRMSSEPGAKGRPLSRQTVEHTRTVLHRAYKIALNRRPPICHINPVAMMEQHLPGKPVVPRVKRLTLDAEAAQRLYAVLTADPYLADYARALLILGVRPQEACALRWRDFRRVGGPKPYEAVVISHAVKKSPTGWYLGEPKSAAGRRTIPVSGEFARWLRWGADTHLPDEFMFPADDGVSMDSPRRRSELVRKVLDAYGMEEWTQYDTRHAAASMLLTQASPVVVARRMGHADRGAVLAKWYDAGITDPEAEASWGSEDMYVDRSGKLPSNHMPSRVAARYFAEEEQRREIGAKRLGRPIEPLRRRHSRPGRHWEQYELTPDQRGAWFDALTPEERVDEAMLRAERPGPTGGHPGRGVDQSPDDGMRARDAVGNLFPDPGEQTSTAPVSTGASASDEAPSAPASPDNSRGRQGRGQEGPDGPRGRPVRRTMTGRPLRSLPRHPDEPRRAP